jgi:vitamin B12 transporter
MGGYSLVNLNASWAVTPAWTLAARLNNVTDKRYELVQGYDTPGSNLFVSLSYSGL